MHPISKTLTILSLCTVLSVPAMAGGGHGDGHGLAQLGPRPFYLVEQMEEGRLKRKLQR